jgi:hypothetical protein
VIRPAWYSITEVPHPRRLALPDLADYLAELFGAEAPIDPARTGAALEVALQMGEYLTEAVRHESAAVCRDDLSIVLHGLNLLTAGLTQISGRLALTVQTGTGPLLLGVPDSARERAAIALADAAGRLLEAAGLLKEAFLHTAVPHIVKEY